MNWNPFFIGIQLCGIALALSPTPDFIGDGLKGYFSATMIVYGMAARRLGGWWL